MIKRTFIKRIALLGATIAMMAGTMATVMAGTVSDEFDICGDGYARCKLTCNANSAKATTDVYASYCLSHIDIYMELELETVNSDGSSEYYDDVWDEREEYFGYTGEGREEESSLELEIKEDVVYNVGTYAYSYHVAKIDGGGSTCYLWTEY